VFSPGEFESEVGSILGQEAGGAGESGAKRKSQFCCLGGGGGQGVAAFPLPTHCRRSSARANSHAVLSGERPLRAPRPSGSGAK
jgi:hypothetical protein